MMMLFSPDSKTVTDTQSVMEEQKNTSHLTILALKIVI